MRPCVVVPAFNAAPTVGSVVSGLREALALEEEAILVVDDGSADTTASRALEAGAVLVRHPRNRGKGAALRSGLERARALGFDVALTVDADGQHPAASAKAVLLADPDPRTLVLGVRDLARVGAPRMNRFSNGISNYFLSRFAGRPLADTQCGLRRYPIEDTLALSARAEGYAYEAEVLLLAIAAKIPLRELVVPVDYPEDRVTHFHAVRDPARIIGTVLRTLPRMKERA